MDNLAQLTRSHRAIAHKKRARREQVKEIVFDEDARRDYLTGFHKRNLQKKEASKQRREEREKQERQELRRENRKMLAERALENSKEVEKAYGAQDDESDDDWDGVASDKSDNEREEDFEGDAQMATVTIVEDFDPSALIYGPEKSTPHQPNEASEAHSQPTSQSSAPRTKTKDKTRLKANKKAKDIKYQTAAARKSDKRKQLKRHTEKAERAGGKQSRKSHAKRR